MKIEVTSLLPVQAGRDPANIKTDSNAKSDSTPDRLVPDVAGAKPIDRDRLDQVIEKMNQTSKIFNHALQFRVADSGRIIVKVIDTNTGDVIRQIPPEQLVDAFDQVDHVIGLLLDHKV